LKKLEEYENSPIYKEYLNNLKNYENSEEYK
jgi:hypothetical protein